MLGSDWRKSSYSNPSGNCVQARTTASDNVIRVEVGDTQNPDGPTLQLTAAAWAAFLKTVR